MQNTSFGIPKSVLVVLVLVLVFAVVSFALFRVFSRADSVPAAASTPASTATQPAYPFGRPTITPTPVPTMPFRVVPTVDLRSFQMPTPVPLPTYTPIPFQSPAPTLTTIAPTVAGWLTFTGKSGVSLSYPTGWLVVEEYNPSSQLQPVSISIMNWHGPLPRNVVEIPGGMTFIIARISPEAVVPQGGTTYLVGVKKYTGFQFIFDKQNPPPDDPWFWVLERGIKIYFNANNQKWVINGSFYPPAENIGNYNQIFYQIVGSVNDEAK